MLGDTPFREVPPFAYLTHCMGFASRSLFTTHFVSFLCRMRDFLAHTPTHERYRASNSQRNRCLRYFLIHSFGRVVSRSDQFSSIDDLMHRASALRGTRADLHCETAHYAGTSLDMLLSFVIHDVLYMLGVHTALERFKILKQ